MRSLWPIPKSSSCGKGWCDIACQQDRFTLKGNEEGSIEKRKKEFVFNSGHFLSYFHRFLSHGQEK